MPLVEKTLTVDGGSVKEPKNVIVPIGTPLEAVFDFCGGFVSEPAKVLYGGPMMGISVKSLGSPILKNNNAILAFNEKEAHLPESTACIRCGRCTLRNLWICFFTAVKKTGVLFPISPYSSPCGVWRFC